MGYITNIQHWLDENGEIAEEMHAEAKELSGFQVLIIDETTKAFPAFNYNTELRCNMKGCQGSVVSVLPDRDSPLKWRCTACENFGIISGWQGTKWDNDCL